MPQSSGRRFVHRLSRPGLPATSSILFASLVLMKLSGYLFYVAMSRLLDAQTYGALGALIAVITVVAIPANAIQAVVARRVATVASHGEAGPLLRRALRDFTIMGVVAGTAVASAARPVARYLHVRSAAATALLGAYILVASITPVLRGALHGLVRYRMLSASLTTVAVLRLALGVVFVSRGWGVAGAAAAFVIAEACGAIPCLPALRRTLRSDGQESAVLGEVARACLAVAGFAVVTNVDVVLARHYFPESQSGLYAAAAVVGRAVLFGAMSLTTLAYPRFAAARRQDAHALLRWVLLGTLMIGGTATVFVAATGQPMMRVIFGAAYGSASNVAVVSAASSAIFAVAGVLMNFEISLASARALAALPASAIEIGAIVLFHRSMLEIAWVTVFAALLLVAASAVLGLRYRAAEGDIAMSDLRML